MISSRCLGMHRAFCGKLTSAGETPYITNGPDRRVGTRIRMLSCINLLTSAIARRSLGLGRVGGPGARSRTR